MDDPDYGSERSQIMDAMYQDASGHVSPYVLPRVFRNCNCHVLALNVIVSCVSAVGRITTPLTMVEGFINHGYPRLTPH